MGMTAVMIAIGLASAPQDGAAAAAPSPSASPEVFIDKKKGPITPTRDNILAPDYDDSVKAQQKAPAIKKMIEIGGQRYTIISYDRLHVSILGGDRALPQTDTNLALRQTALRRATGCQLREGSWINAASVWGKLDCVGAPIP